MEKTDAKRLAGNTVTLFVRMVLVLIVTLYSSRVVLRTLGFDDFGIYTAVASVVIAAMISPLYFRKKGLRYV